jgi:acetyl-CoA carboxylase biotin carboxyl carrier protein
MTNGDSDQGALDVERLDRLARLMIEHDLTELDLRQDGSRIHLRRGGYTVSVPAAPPDTISTPAVSDTGEEDGTYVTIKSPMVGKFYIRPTPESEPFVKVGQEIAADTTVCIIEAMKVFNEIPAEVSGKIAAVLVENEEPVEFGKPLFKVRMHS